MEPRTGTAALETGDPIDFTRLRRDRFRRVLASMDRHGVHVLILSKPDNARYASGARPLWTAGRGGFSPRAVVLRDGEALHLMSYSDYLVPAEIPRERIFAPSWNPEEILTQIKRITGKAHGLRIGVDQMSPSFHRMLVTALPKATFVNGSSVMNEARKIKTAEEAACLVTATAIAEAALVQTMDTLNPGVEERALLGIFERAATRYGVTVATTQGGFCVQPLEPNASDIPFSRMVSGRPVHAGELVSMNGGILYNGYAGEAGRTRACDSAPSARQQALLTRRDEALSAMLDQCRPGRTVGELRRAFECIAPLPNFPIAYGIGLGMEAPLIGIGLGDGADAEPLQAGMALALQPYTWERGAGGALSKEVVLITEEGHRLLSALPSDYPYSAL